MKQTLERLQAFQHAGIREQHAKSWPGRLSRSGALDRLHVLPLRHAAIVFVVRCFYLFVITHFSWSPMMKILAAFAARRCSASTCPIIFVSNMIQRASNPSCAPFPTRWT
jgi:hypothetical protein